MKSAPQDDPLVALWQTETKLGADHLLRGLQRIHRSHQRLNQTIWGIMIGIAVLLFFEETTGHVKFHSLLGVIWTIGLVVGAFWQRRARCNRADQFTLDTISLLRFMIARAKRDVLMARCLYAGVPFGAAVGYVVAKAAGLSTSPQAEGSSSHLHLIQTGAGLGALIVMVVIGATLARSRNRQLQELSEKLTTITAEP